MWKKRVARKKKEEERRRKKKKEEERRKKKREENSILRLRRQDKYNLHNALTKVYGVTHNQTEDPSLHSSHNHYASVLSFQIVQSKGPVIRISLVQAEVHVKVSQGKPWSMGEHRGHIQGSQHFKKTKFPDFSLIFPW